MPDNKDDIKRYLTGEMTGAERHDFEKKVLTDPFLADALEGAEHLNENDFLKDVQNLDSSITKRSKKSTSVFSWSLRIAAGVAVLIISGYYIWNLTQSIDETSPIALKEIPLTESPEGEKDSIFDTKSKNEESTEAASSQPQKQDAPEETDKSSSSQPIAKAGKKEVSENPQGLPSNHIAAIHEDAESKISVPAAEGKRMEALTEKSASDNMPKAALMVKSAVTTSAITGKVTSRDDGYVLPGVNVTIKGTTIGTITDVQGNYRIETTQENPTLVFSFIGLQSTEVQAMVGEELDVELSPDITQLSEVVVVGYGSQSESTTPTVDLAHPVNGYRSFNQYLQKNVLYPEEAKQNKTEGRVTVEFFVETDGSLTGFTVIRGIGDRCDEELIRLIREGPTWVPTKKEGIPTRDKARVRLKFELPK